MNAKSTIRQLRAMSDFISRAANDPKYYNTHESQMLENISYNLYCQSNDLENLCEFYGLPQLNQIEVN